MIAGQCTGPDRYVPCFGGPRSQAMLFTCIRQAELPSGCTKEIVSQTDPQNRFEITIWLFEPVGHGATLPNCHWQTNGDLRQDFYSYCVAVSDTTFVVTQPQQIVAF